MKKSDCPAGISGRLIVKYLLMMKLIIILVFCLGFQAIAFNGNSQERINLELKNTSIIAILKKIQSRYSYQFFYGDELGLEREKVDLYVKNATIEYVMEQLLQTTPYSYKKINKGLVVIIGQASETAALPVTGKITNETGEPLAGVSVIEKGTNNGVTTNEEGVFYINVKDENAVIIISSVGYGLQEIQVANNDHLSIILSLLENTLSQVVVTALGIERHKKTLTYSTQDVNAASLTQARDVNIVNGLQGKIAGLNITSGSSGLGSAVRVVLRGNRSIQGNNQPLYVIDGIQVSDISWVNPDNIASMNVLKGANAAALYGSAGQNGVIIIETKKGMQGTHISLSTTYMLQQAVQSIPFQYKYGQGYNGIYNKSSEASWGPLLNDSLVEQWSLAPGKIGTTYPFSAHPDTKDRIFQTGHNSATNLSVSTGNEKTQAAFNYTYTNATGIIPNNALGRHNLGLRLTTKLSSKLTLDGKVEYLRQNLKNIIDEGESSFSPFRQIYVIPPNIRHEDLIEYEVLRGVPVQNYWSAVVTAANPYWTIYRDMRYNKVNTFTSMASLNYRFTNDLSLMLRGTYAGDGAQAEEDSYYGTYRDPKGRISLSSINSESYSGDFLFGYNKQITRNWSFNSNLGGELRHASGSTLVGTSDVGGLIMINKFGLSNALTPKGANSFSEWEKQSLYYVLRTGWKNAVFLEHTGRNDWSSTLPKESRSYFYPSIGVSGVVSELVNLPQFFSYFKIRASWVKVGNDTRPYQLSRYATGLSGGPVGFLLISSQLPNKQLKPESTTSNEVGVEMDFFQSRVGFDLTLYKTNTNNQLFSQALPPGSGALTFFTNGGDVENKGIELILKTTPVKTASFNWDLNFNFSSNKSLVKRLAENSTRMVVGSDLYMRDFVLEVGQPFGQIYGKGLSRDSLGRVKVDAVGKPMLTPGRTVLLGNVNPKWNGGIFSNLAFKGVNMSFVISHKQGGVIASQTDAILYGDGHVEETVQGREGGLIFGKNIFTEYKAVKADGSPNDIPVTAQTLWTLLGGRAAPVAEVLKRSATNTRLREMTLGYTIPGAKLGFLNISSIEVSLVGRNLFFIYRASPTIDPDFIVGTATASEGFQSFAPPTTRSYGANLKINF